MVELKQRIRPADATLFVTPEFIGDSAWDGKHVAWTDRLRTSAPK